MKLFFNLIMIFFIWLGCESYSQVKIQNDSLLNKPVKHSYKKIGLAFGTPGDLNIIFGVSNMNICMGLSAGMNGVQIGAGFTAFSEKYFELNLLLNLSYLKINQNETYKNSFLTSNNIYACFGPILEFNFYGIHTQLGIGFGLEQIPSPPLFFQIGYAYRWGK